MIDDPRLHAHVLSTRIMAGVSAWVGKRFRVRLPDVVVVLLLEAVLSLSGYLLWILSGVARAPLADLWGAWGCLFSAACLLLVKQNLDRFIRLMSNYAPRIFGQNIDLFNAWSLRVFDNRRQLIFSTVFAVIFLPLTFWFFQVAIGREALWLVSPVLFINLGFIGNGFYWVVSLPGAARVIAANAQKPESFDPRNLVWVEALSGIYQYAALSTSLIGIAILVPLTVRPSEALSIFLISFSWFGLVWALVFFPYFYAISGLSAFIKRELHEAMTSLQERLYRLVTGDLTADAAEQIEVLLQLYAQMQGYEQSVWRFGSNSGFVNSLLLPLVSFVILNYSFLADFLRQSAQFFLP